MYLPIQAAPVFRGARPGKRSISYGKRGVVASAFTFTADGFTSPLTRERFTDCTCTCEGGTAGAANLLGTLVEGQVGNVFGAGRVVRGVTFSPFA
jgi:hypothetical protein